MKNGEVEGDGCTSCRYYAGDAQYERGILVKPSDLYRVLGIHFVQWKTLALRDTPSVRGSSSASGGIGERRTSTCVKARGRGGKRVLNLDEKRRVDEGARLFGSGDEDDTTRQHSAPVSPLGRSGAQGSCISTLDEILAEFACLGGPSDVTVKLPDVPCFPLPGAVPPSRANLVQPGKGASGPDTLPVLLLGVATVGTVTSLPYEVQGTKGVFLPLLLEKGFIDPCSFETRCRNPNLCNYSHLTLEASPPDELKRISGNSVGHVQLRSGSAARSLVHTVRQHDYICFCDSLC
jgi:hypothetical protein